jgi:hypothetical protein
MGQKQAQNFHCPSSGNFFSGKIVYKHPEYRKTGYSAFAAL